MCQILACVKARAPMEFLERAIQNNKDGTGACWLEGKKVRWIKGLSIGDASRYLETLPMPFALHFRMATAGGVGTALTHPFTVERVPDRGLTGAARAVLMHNGHMNNWELYARLAGIDTQRHGPWSDSRAIAAIVAIRGEGILKALDGNRWLVLDREGPRFYGNWIEREGWAMSSPSYSSDYWHDLGADAWDWSPEMGCYLRETKRRQPKEERGVTVVDPDGKAWPSRSEEHRFNKSTGRWERWSRR